MAIIVAIKRGWISRKDGLERLMKMVKFLAKAGSYHGVFPHFWDGRSGQTIPFSRKDDGGDLVETSFLIAGPAVRATVLRRQGPAGGRAALRINSLWLDVEWDWHTRDGGQRAATGIGARTTAGP